MRNYLSCAYDFVCDKNCSLIIWMVIWWNRRYYRFSSNGSGRCDGNSTAPPCIGWEYYSLSANVFDFTLKWWLLKFVFACSWVEMMAPVFSRAAWRCVWYMVQVHNQTSLLSNFVFWLWLFSFSTFMYDRFRTTWSMLGA